MKIREVEADMLYTIGRAGGRTDSRTDMKLIVALRNFLNVPKNRPSYKARFEPTYINTKKNANSDKKVIYSAPNPDTTVIQPIQYVHYPSRLLGRI